MSKNKMDKEEQEIDVFLEVMNMYLDRILRDETDKLFINNMKEKKND